jgi:hypothetical protein
MVDCTIWTLCNGKPTRDPIYPQFQTTGNQLSARSKFFKDVVL